MKRNWTLSQKRFNGHSDAQPDATEYVPEIRAGDHSPVSGGMLWSAFKVTSPEPAS
jgi:hypothetical protein